MDVPHGASMDVPHGAYILFVQDLDGIIDIAYAHLVDVHIIEAWLILYIKHRSDFRPLFNVDCRIRNSSFLEPFLSKKAAVTLTAGSSL